MRHGNTGDSGPAHCRRQQPHCQRRHRASSLAASSLRQHPRRLQFCFQQSPRAVSHGLRSRKWLPASLADSAAFRQQQPRCQHFARPAASPPAFSHREPLAVSSLTVGCLMINIVPFAVCCCFSTSAASHQSVSAQAALMIDFSNRHAQHRHSWATAMNAALCVCFVHVERCLCMSTRTRDSRRLQFVDANGLAASSLSRFAAQQIRTAHSARFRVRSAPCVLSLCSLNACSRVFSFDGHSNLRDSRRLCVCVCQRYKTHRTPAPRYRTEHTIKRGGVKGIELFITELDGLWTDCALVHAARPE